MGAAALVHGFSSLLWCQGRWGDGAEPKGIQPPWCEGEWADGWGQTDKESHEDGGKGGRSLRMMQTRRVDVQGTLLSILVLVQLHLHPRVQSQQVTWGQRAHSSSARASPPKPAVRISDMGSGCPERLWGLHPEISKT